jgi:hypothetical protein
MQASVWWDAALVRTALTRVLNSPNVIDSKDINTCARFNWVEMIRGHKMFCDSVLFSLKKSYPLGTNVSSTSSFDLHLVELSTNVKSTKNVNLPLDLG